MSRDHHTPVQIDYDGIIGKGSGSGIVLRDNLDASLYLISCWHILKGREIAGSDRAEGPATALTAVFDQMDAGGSSRHEFLDLSSARFSAKAGQCQQRYTFQPEVDLDAFALLLAVRPHSRYIINLDDVVSRDPRIGVDTVMRSFLRDVGAGGSGRRSPDIAVRDC